MSGAPAILKYEGWHKKGYLKNGHDFLGIYSGRVPKDQDSDNYFKAQLGIIWKKKLIREVIEGRKLSDI